MTTLKNASIDNDDLKKIARRTEMCPTPEFDDSLPINQHREEIAELIHNNQVVIVCGETGSGKTTQIPKICLTLGLGINGKIAHTQPRRLAARSVAARIAEELNSELGQAVGYKIRFNDRSNPETYIKLMTDGILLAESQHDQLLREYDTLIIDEAHERSLNIDFLLGYLKMLLPKRPDLKLIITSATIDPQSFSRFFNDAPVIEVSGRSFPVETRYRSLLADQAQGSSSPGSSKPSQPPPPPVQDKDQIQGIIHAVDELAAENSGDVLIFVSGEREIREATDALQRHLQTDTDILPLYSRLSTKEQDRIFHSGGRRRIIIATNVAETSLTVPGIRHVIDTGLARISRYSYRSKVQRLPIEAISQASANQRKGRCGRTSAGICIRLYSEEDFALRPLFTDPEILRTNLASVILSLSNLRLGKLEDFPFLNPPDSRVIRDGYRLLQELDALDNNMRITASGRELARLPVDPRLGRMLLAGKEYKCTNECLIIASALSVQDPRERPHDKRQQATEKHSEFKADDSDFITLLNIWSTYHTQKDILSQNKLRRWCRDHFLSWMRMREWLDIHKQLARQTRQKETRSLTASHEEIHRALLTGLLSHIGQHYEGREYKGPRQREFRIGNESVLAKKSPRWIMSASLIETQHLFASTNAKIEPEWIEHAAAHRCQKHYSAPHWVHAQGRVMANEQVTVFGLIVVAKRAVHYGPIAPKTSREIFIREALVEGLYHSKSKTLSDNQTLREDLERIEHKRRRRDVLVDDETIYNFYAKQIPDNIYQSQSFERWLKNAQKDQPDILRMQKEDLLQQQTAPSPDLFPDHIDLRNTHFKLTYRFEPGHALDGVTAHIPVQQLNTIQQHDFDWLVPGLIREKITNLIKTLPKVHRRTLVPVPDTVSEFLLWWSDTSNPANRANQAGMPGQILELTSALSRFIKHARNITIPMDAWSQDALPDHLLMGIRLLDSDGNTLAVDHHLQTLKAEYGDMANRVFDEAPSWDIEQDNIQSWDFAELPEQLNQRTGKSTITGYPALCADEQGKVSIEVFNDVATANQSHHAGLQALILKCLPPQARVLRKQLPDLQQQCLYYSNIGSCQELQNDIINASINHSCLNMAALPRTEAGFKACLAEAKKKLIDTANRFCQSNLQTLKLYHQCSLELDKQGNKLPEEVYQDIELQLMNLIYPDYLQLTGPVQLKHFPRYLKGILSRLQKISHNPSKDVAARETLTPFMNKYTKEAEQWLELSVEQQSKLEACHWMLEEFRVSIFAQELGTACPASAKRLGKLFDEYYLL